MVTSARQELKAKSSPAGYADRVTSVSGNATVMVVQHADRYGMSALHQLRGRVGRGSKPSICLLFSDSKSDLARQRLDARGSDAGNRTRGTGLGHE